MKVGLVGKTNFMEPKLTPQDLNNIERLLQPKFDGLQADINAVGKKVDHVIDALDGRVRITELHGQELLVLGAQQQKTTEVLVRKGIATSDELAAM